MGLNMCNASLTNPSIAELFSGEIAINEILFPCVLENWKIK